MRKSFFTVVLLLSAFFSFSFAQNNANKTSDRIKGVDVPTVQTICPAATDTNITSVSAICNGTITSDGNLTVTNRGFCYNTDPYNVPVFSSTSTDLNVQDLGAWSVGSYSLTLNSLTPLTVYYFRAFAVNAAGVGYGDLCSFTTLVGLAPAIPTLISPIDSSKNVPIDTNLVWKSVDYTTIYIIEYGTDQDLTHPTKLTSSTPTLPVSLDYGTTYYWHVRAINSAGASDWSVTWSFTTGNKPLDTPTLVTPLDSSINVQFNPTMTWNEVNMASDYVCEIDVNSSFTSPSLEVSSHVTGLNYISTKVTAPNTTYYWRVRAFNSVGEYSAWSEVWYFTTKCLPTAPVLTSPVDYANCVDYLAPTITWDSETCATGYVYELSIDNFATTPYVLSDTAKTNSAVLPKLLQTTTYYWRVKAFNASDEGTWTRFQFTTKVAAPEIPTLNFPADGATNVADKASCTWTSANGTFFMYQMSKESDFSTIFNSGSTTGTSFTAPSIGSNQTIYWRVKAMTDCDTTGWSTASHYTVGTTSVEDNTNANATIMPNPANNYVEISGVAGDVVSYELYNSVGQRINTVINNNRIDLTNITSGVYNLVIIADGKKVVKSISVIK